MRTRHVSSCRHGGALRNLVRNYGNQVKIAEAGGWHRGCTRQASSCSNTRVALSSLAAQGSLRQCIKAAGGVECAKHAVNASNATPDTNGWGKELLDQPKRADKAKAGQVAPQTREHATLFWQGLLARLYFTVLVCNRVKLFQHALVLRAERVAGGVAGGGYISGIQLAGHCKHACRGIFLRQSHATGVCLAALLRH
jgi:hypothetical protein